MTLRDLMARHGRGVLVDPDYFGESGTYHFEDGTERTVSIDVRRLGRVTAEESDVAFLVAEVFVPNDSTVGITSEPADGDELTCEIEYQSPQRCRIERTISSDENGFVIEVRR